MVELNLQAQIAENEHIDNFFFATTQKYFVLYLYLCTRFDKNPLSAAFGKELKRVWFSALTGTTIRVKRVKQLKESYTV